MAKTDCREVIEAFEAFLNAPEARRFEIAGARSFQGVPRAPRAKQSPGATAGGRDSGRRRP